MSTRKYNPAFLIAVLMGAFFCSVPSADALTTGTTSYSNANTGAVSGSIQGTSAQWLGFTATNLTLNGAAVNYQFNLAGGYALTLTAALTGNTTVSNHTVPTISTAPFGSQGYTGITGDVAFYPAYTSGSTLNDTISLTNIVLADVNGVQVTGNWTMIVADAEDTATGETISGQTNGGNWQQLDYLNSSGGNGSVSGLGTQSFVMNGSTNSKYGAYLVGTTAPTTLSGGLYDPSGRESFAVGVIVPPVPEPSVWAGMVFGAVLLMIRRRCQHGSVLLGVVGWILCRRVVNRCAA